MDMIGVSEWNQISYWVQYHIILGDEHDCCSYELFRI